MRESAVKKWKIHFDEIRIEPYKRLVTFNRCGQLVMSVVLENEWQPGMDIILTGIDASMDAKLI